ncbi:hypothetical protein ACET57_04100 [Aeromonas veronii]
MLLATFVIYFFYISVKYQAGVFALFSNSSIEELNILRHSLSSGGGINSFNKIFVKSWIPMLSYTLFFIYLKSNIKFIYIIISFMLGGLASVYFIEKSVFFFFLIGYIAVYLYAGYKINAKIIIAAIIGSLLIVSLMYLATYGDRVSGASYLIDIIVHRTATQSVGSVMSLHYFDSHDFLYFSGVSNLLASISGGDFKSVYSTLIDYYVPESADTSGALSSFAAGDAYGLFGYLGITFGAVIAALFYAFLEASRYGNVLAVLFVGTYGVYYSHFYLASGFYGYIWPVGLVYNLAPFLFIFIVSQIGLRNSTHRKALI